MKRFLFLALLAFPLLAQQDRPVRYFPTDPVNPCSVITPFVNDWVSGRVWNCVGAAGVNNGIWNLLSPAVVPTVINGFNDVRQFNFTAQAPGGTLTATVPATITMRPCPAGVGGADVLHSLYISGGTGTAEAVTITGGTCVSGAAIGTLQFTPANSHSGAWTIASATAGIHEALSALGAGGSAYCPSGTYTFRGPASVNAATQTLFGDLGCVIQAAANAQIKNMLTVSATATGFVLSGTTWDGNRSNAGSSQGGNDPTYALLMIHATGVSIKGAEIKNGNAVGVNVQGDSITPVNTRFSGNNIHDNGGVVGATGIGVGVRLGGAMPPDQTLFTGNHFEKNYNTVGSIHFANAINAAGATNTTVTGNTFLNNLNTLGGGQIYLANSTGDCTGEVSATITGNNFEQNLFGVLDESSAGIEICGKGTVVSGNTVTGTSKYGIVIDGASTYSQVTGNRVVTTTGDGILVGGSNNNTISDNTVVAPRGITWFDNTTTFTTFVFQNNVAGSAAPFSGTFPIATHGVYVANNPGWNPRTGTDEVTITASPFSYQALTSPEVEYIIGGTLTTAIKNGSGNSLCSATPCTVTMYPGETLVLVYSSGVGMHFFRNTM
jgi:parallel beta-helix repeat protein